MRTSMIAASGLLLMGTIVAAPAEAQEQEPPKPAPGRYELKPVEGGFLRLDHESGLTAFCKPSGEGYACRPTAEGSSADAAMIAALETRIAALEAKVKALSGDPSALKGPPARDPTLELPSDDQVDRVASFLERTLKRLKKLAAEAQKDPDQPL